jgi:trimethylamine-N-oxide reductase cytochrome c-type subunit TorC
MEIRTLLLGLAACVIGLGSLHAATGYKELFGELQASAAKTKARAGDVLFAIATKSLFIERPASADAASDGRLIAATPVKVLKVDGDWLQVELSGWQQQGAERAIYAKQGQRILTAALGPPAVEKVQQGKGITDQNTDQVWIPATLTAWTRNDNLVTDVNKVWDYSQQMYSAACGTCHPAHPTDHFLANQWISTISGMRPRTSLDDEETRILQKYLQMHAKDSASANDGQGKP